MSPINLILNFFQFLPLSQCTLLIRKNRTYYCPFSLSLLPFRLIKAIHFGKPAMWENNKTLFLFSQKKTVLKISECSDEFSA